MPEEDAAEQTACPGCGSTAYDQDTGLSSCVFCGMDQCSDCDMGEGVPCLHCDQNEED